MGPAPRPKEQSLDLSLAPSSEPSVLDLPSYPSASQFRPAQRTFTASEPTRGPTLAPPSSPNPPEAAPASLAPPSPPGKKHILVLSVLRAEDTGEVRFQAGPAQSVAQLEVEGKQLGHGRPGVNTVYPGTGKLAAGPRNPTFPTPSSRGSPGADHREQCISWGAGDFGLRVERNGVVA